MGIKEIWPPKNGKCVTKIFFFKTVIRCFFGWIFPWKKQIMNSTERRVCSLMCSLAASPSFVWAPTAGFKGAFLYFDKFSTSGCRQNLFHTFRKRERAQRGKTLLSTPARQAQPTPQERTSCRINKQDASGASATHKPVMAHLESGYWWIWRMIRHVGRTKPLKHSPSLLLVQRWRPGLNQNISLLLQKMLNILFWPQREKHANLTEYFVLIHLCYFILFYIYYLFILW